MSLSRNILLGAPAVPLSHTDAIEFSRFTRDNVAVVPGRVGQLTKLPGKRAAVSAHGARRDETRASKPAFVSRETVDLGRSINTLEQRLSRLERRDAEHRSDWRENQSKLRAEGYTSVEQYVEVQRQVDATFA